MSEIIQKLHENAVSAVKQYLGAEAVLIEALMELDQEHGYRNFNKASLSEYVIQVLGLSEDPAQTLIRISRKCAQVPRLLELIQSQEISVTNVRLICPILTEENQETWLSAASHLSKRELELAIVSEYPERAIKEKLKRVSEKLWELRVGFSNEQQELLRRVQDLESTRLSKPATLGESLEAAIESYLEKRDPVRKASRAWDRKVRAAQAGQKNQAAEHPTPSRDGRPARKKLKAELLHEVALRDLDRCTFCYESGSRCESRRWMANHHQIHVADGGQDTLGNIQKLCGQHHALVHFQQSLKAP